MAIPIARPAQRSSAILGKMTVPVARLAVPAPVRVVAVAIASIAQNREALFRQVAYFVTSSTLPAACRGVAELFALGALRSLTVLGYVPLVMAALARQDLAILNVVAGSFAIRANRDARGRAIAVICDGTVGLGGLAGELFRVLLGVENVCRRKREHC